MNTHFLIHQIRVSGFRRSARKVLRRLLKSPLEARRVSSMMQRPSRLPFTSSPAALQRLIAADALDGLRSHSSELLDACDHYSEHQFPLPGVGWMPVHHRTNVPGIGSMRYTQEAFPYDIDPGGEWITHLVNATNSADSQRIWKMIAQPKGHEAHPYQPMDWQRDLRSGYVWSEGQWQGYLSLGNGKGVDPKSTWDLGRLHALLHLACGCVIAEDVDRKDRYWTALRAILLDFLALNPPGFGIQWKSPMDVAIRLANILLAVDLAQHHRKLDDDALGVITRAVHDHAHYVLDHLEWSDGMRANHFLANLSGLAAAAAYLEDCDLRRSIIALLQRSLMTESRMQFLSDGGNFEASLPYHRLSAEMLCWAWAFALRCEEIASTVNQAEFKTILQRILDFSLNVCYRGLHMPQIGDHDSGRFLPLLPFHWTADNSERPFDISAVCGLLESFLGCETERRTQAEFIFIRSLRSRIDAPAQAVEVSRNETFYSAPNFGIWRYSHGAFDLILRAGGIGQHGKGGHAHNDQLSCCLALNGMEFFADPGTYVYTALPEERNRFRSTAMHNVLQCAGREQNAWSSGSQETLFWLMGDRAKARVIEATPSHWLAEHRGFGFIVQREVLLHETGFEIIDRCESDEEKVIRFHLRPECAILSVYESSITILRDRTQLYMRTTDATVSVSPSRYSPEYGMSVATKCVELRSRKRSIVTHIESSEAATA